MRLDLNPQQYGIIEIQLNSILQENLGHFRPFFIGKYYSLSYPEPTGVITVVQDRIDYRSTLRNRDGYKKRGRMYFALSPRKTPVRKKAGLT